MKPKTLITLSFAVGCGLVAALLMKQASARKPTVQEPRVAVLTVVEQISTGQAVSATKVKFKEIPQSLVPEGAITSAEQFEQRAVKSPAYPGEILTLDRLGEKGVMGQSITIEPGYRVIGIPVDASNSFSGMLQPGDRVDILVTYKVQYEMPNNKKVERTKTSTLLEYVKVFATDNRTVDKGADQYSAESTAQVHLALTPEQATWVKLAQEKGRLSLAWRSELDTDLADVGTVADALLDELNSSIGGVDIDPRYAGYGDEEEEFETEDYTMEEFEDDDSEDAEEYDFSDFLATVDDDSSVDAGPGVWTMQVFNGADAESVEVPMPQPLPVREAPQTDGTNNAPNESNGKPSAIGTSASLMRQILLGF